MSNLPNLMWIRNILPLLSTKDLVSIFLVNHRFHDLRDFDELWLLKIRNEYPYFIPFPTNRSYFQLYIFLYNSKYMPVYYHGDRIGYAYINEDEMNLSAEVLFSKFLQRPCLVVQKDLTLMGQENQKVIFYDDDSSKPFVFKELTSHLGNPPIYEFIIYYSIFSSEQFEIIERREEGSSIWTTSTLASHDYLLNIATILSKYTNTVIDDTNLKLYIKDQLIKIGHFH